MAARFTRGDLASFVEGRTVVHALVHSYTGNPDTANVVLIGVKGKKLTCWRRFPDSVCAVGELWQKQYLLCHPSDAPAIKEELEARFATKSGKAFVESLAPRRRGRDGEPQIAEQMPISGPRSEPWEIPTALVDLKRPNEDGKSATCFTYRFEAYLERSEVRWNRYREELEYMESRAPVRWMVYAACEIAGLAPSAVASWLGSSPQVVYNTLSRARSHMDIALGWNVEVPGHSWHLEQDEFIGHLRPAIVRRLAAMGAPVDQLGRVRRDTERTSRALSLEGVA